MRIEEPLAYPDGLGRHLNQLVVLDMGDRVRLGGCREITKGVCLRK